MSFDLKKCSVCLLEKDVCYFSISVIKNGITYYRSLCKECNKLKQQESHAKHYAKNKDIILKNKKKYYENNKTNIINNVFNYNMLHKENKKTYNDAYYEINKDIIGKKQRIYKRNRRKFDLEFRMREDVSTLIRRTLKNNHSSKQNKSCMNYLSYSISDLKIHLENLFEPWMTWNNYGSYNKNKWDDNDESTWKWNIDHIIPQSKLPYISMEDNNFKQCWSLNNLRPFSAKQNIIDGVTRIRHGEKDVF